ncbi:MAG: MalY/PatB family protein [Clostridia bacterium]
MYDFDSVVDRRNTGTHKWAFAPEPLAKKSILPLSIADMEFKMAPAIQEALHCAVEHGICGYTVIDDAYFEAVAAWMLRRHGFAVKREWLCCTPGVVSALGIAVRAFTQKGDGIIIQPPVYPPFWAAVRDNKRELLENRLIYDNGKYTMDYDNLEKLCARPSTKLMILCSPHNPVGRVWSVDELTRLGDICRRHGVIIVVDEIHQDVMLPGNTHTVFSTIDGMADNCITCTAVSKTFNLAGLCCSNIFIQNEKLREKFKIVQERDSTMGIPFYARAASIAAYTDCDAWVNEMLEYVNKNFEFMYDFIDTRLPQVKCIRAQGTFLAWTDMRALGLGDDAAQENFMVNKGLLALDEGYIFGTGGNGFERWNIALPRTGLEEALLRLERAIKE